MTTRSFLVSLLAVAIAVVACSSDPAAPPGTTVDGGGVDDAGGSPSETGPGPTTDGGAGGPWTAGACGTCLVAECKNRRDACDGEPSCAEHAKCVDACAAGGRGTPDEACLKACPASQGAAATKLRAAYDTCLRSPGTACPACTVPPAGDVDVLNQTCAGSNDPNVCFKCEDDNCCNTYKECADEPECNQQLKPCLQACNDQKCEDACYAAHPKGVGPWARRLTCLLARCGAECKGSALDPCVQCSTVDVCRNSTARCTSDRECFLISECVSGCAQADDVCIAKCKTGFSEKAGDLFDAFLACPLVSCVAQCG